MPRKKDPIHVGKGECLDLSCRGTNHLYVNARGYLYGRCEKCGACDQRITERVQSQLWYGMTPDPGVTVPRPRNVPEHRPDWLPDPDAAANAAAAQVSPVQVPEPEPAPEPAAAPIGAPAAKPKRGGVAGLLIFMGCLGLTVAGLGSAIR